MKLLIPILMLSCSAHAFDLGGFVQKVGEIKKSSDDKKSAKQKAEAEQERNKKAPSWDKMFYYTIKNQPTWKMEKIVNAYWMAEPESNYYEMKDNEFEFEKLQQAKIEELKKNVAEFKPSEYLIDVSANLGKYNFKTKSITLEGVIDEENILLTTAREGEFLTQKPTMTVTPNPVSQEQDWQTVPTGYIFQITNPKALEAIPVQEELARKIASTQGGRGADVDILFELVGVKLNDKKWGQYGTVGILKIKVKEVKASWTNGPDGNILIQ